MVELPIRAKTVAKNGECLRILEKSLKFFSHLNDVYFKLMCHKTRLMLNKHVAIRAVKVNKKYVSKIVVYVKRSSI